MTKAIFLVSFIGLLGCSTTRAWKKVAADPDVTPEKKAIISGKVAAMFPPETKYVMGETRIDTVYYDNAISDTVTTVAIDTLTMPERIIYKTRTITHTRTDTIYLTNSAQLSSMQRELSTANTINASQKATITDLQQKLKAERKWFWLFIALCAAVVGVAVARIYGKIRL